MSDAPAPAPSLADQVRGKLADAAAPLTLKDVMKGFKKPAKTSKPDFEAGFTQALDDEIRVGRAFRYPSGKKGEERYWSKDEKQHLREEAVALAGEPRAMAWLTKELGKRWKSDAGFVESLVRDLIGEDKLYEHAVKGKPAFASYAPPPPPAWHELSAVKKEVAAAVKAVEKLLAKANVSTDDVLAMLRDRFAASDEPSVGGDANGSDFTVTPSAVQVVGSGPEPTAPPADDRLEALILDAVSNAGPGSVLSLADLRRGMPTEDQGRAFDDTVLRLAEAGRIRVFQDADPAQFTPEQRAEFVSDRYGNLYTTTKRG